ncbi:MAG: TatD family hydrolase [Oscillospiraceae bacterium]|nr:TatD family hydrolase [Oscillospiraceae bacterium]
MKTKIFDTHTHYDDKAYGKSAHELISRILREDVAGFIAVGCSMTTVPKSLEIAEKYDNVYASVGVHPHYAGKLPPDYLDKLEQWTKSPFAKAVGEIGLDYHYDGRDDAAVRENQVRIFREQLVLAAKSGLPVIVHSRDSAHDTMEILREFRKSSQNRIVMHCYSGSLDMARELVKMDVCISFTGVLTFRNARKAAEVCREIPLSHIMLETDCPYMSPEPYRGRICDSSMITKTAEKVAEIKGLTVGEVAEVCNKNAEEFFGISI